MSEGLSRQWESDRCKTLCVCTPGHLCASEGCEGLVCKEGAECDRVHGEVQLVAHHVWLECQGVKELGPGRERAKVQRMDPVGMELGCRASAAPMGTVGLQWAVHRLHPAASCSCDKGFISLQSRKQELSQG